MQEDTPKPMAAHEINLESMGFRGLPELLTSFKFEIKDHSSLPEVTITYYPDIHRQTENTQKFNLVEIKEQ